MLSSALDIIGEVMSRAMKELGSGNVVEQSLLHVATIAQLECCGHRKQLPRVNGVLLPVQSTPGPRFGPLPGSALRLALRLCMELHASDPRDRIYGMLAIPGLPNFDIEISYRETRTAGDVYTDFTRACIRKS